VVTRAVPPPPRVAFDRERAALAANPGHPLNPAAIENIRHAEPAPAHMAYRPAAAAPARAMPAAHPESRPAVNPGARPENRPAPAARPAEEHRDSRSTAKKSTSKKDRDRDKGGH
jgi:hypothetical protein